MMTKTDRRLLGIGIFFGALAIAAVLDSYFPPDLTRAHELSRELHGPKGEVLHVTQSRDEKWRLQTNLDQVDALYINMLVEREDRYFWWHPGINPLSFLRAAYQYITHGRVISGASTLTMQVARLLEPRPRTLSAKFIQALRALQLESLYSKREILQLYMTLAPFGGNLEGVRAASHAYFGKSPSRLLPSEAALLVALPQNPKVWTNGAFAPQTLLMRNRALGQALEAGLINPEIFDVAARDPLPKMKYALPRDVPHLARLLMGNNTTQVVTCHIDRSLQKKLEHVASSYLRPLTPDINIAIVVAHHPTRRVIAYVGSSDFFDTSRAGQVDYIQAVRSPGSTLKPFIYGLAFDDGLISPSTMVLDDRKRFGTYMPDNFDKTFYGVVSVREALVFSLNVPAVDLLNRIGTQRFLGALETAGIRPYFSDKDTTPGLSIALGGLGMTLEQLVTLYCSLPQKGQLQQLALSQTNPESQHLLCERSARQVTEILSETLFNETGQAAGKIAVKTGTSYGYRDAWALGYNEEYVVGVWIGRPDGAPFGLGTGRTLAVPVLQQVFKTLPVSPLSSASLYKPSTLNLKAIEGKRDVLLKERPEILFPVHGTTLELLKDQEPNPVILTAQGGARPYTWLVDGLPISTNVWQKRTSWKPDKLGFYTVTLMDGQGLSQSIQIEIN